MSELLKMIDEQVDLEQKQEWRITDDATADWWIERRQEELSDLERLEKQVKDKIEFYSQRLEAVQKQKGFIIEQRDGRLIDYFERIPEDSKRKTKTLIKYQLPTGTLQKKFKAPKLVRNDEELIKYVEVNAPDYIETKKALKWGEFKKQTKVVNGQVVDTKTGEILPIRVEEQAPVFEVKL